jgi:outer membrane protein assembly factor BamB
VLYSSRVNQQRFPREQGGVLALMGVLLAACSSGREEGARALLDLPASTTRTDVVTYHNDVARTAQNLTETLLTPARVRPQTFGLLRELAVTGRVDAQPLYLSHLQMNGTAHNVVFVATEHGLMYAFDADTGGQLWVSSLIGSGETPSNPVYGCNQVEPEIGISSTPVIDRTSAQSGVIYAVAMSMDASGQYIQRIHALDVTTGVEMAGGPQTIQAKYQANGHTTRFDPTVHKERAALLLLNGIVYTTWSSHCDVAPYGGWIIGYDARTLQQTSALNLAANNGGAAGPAIWQGAGGPAADPEGNIYVLAGNGVFDTVLDANGFPSKGNYGNSFVKITVANGELSVADYFSMSQTVLESAMDRDLGSSAPLVLPDQTTPDGIVKHLAIGGGKDGNLYVVDRENMGKFNPTSDAIYEELIGATPGGVWASPAYFNDTVYYGDVLGTLKGFSLKDARLSSAPAAQTSYPFSYNGASPSVSANGTQDAIVWVIEAVHPEALHAFTADLGSEIYNSAQVPGRDNFGEPIKFAAATIADGKVFAGSASGVGIFGLFPQSRDGQSSAR